MAFWVVECVKDRGDFIDRSKEKREKWKKRRERERREVGKGGERGRERDTLYAIAYKISFV